MPKIFAFHQLNDFSGSPKVLSQLLRGWVAAGRQVALVSSCSGPGFLSGIEGVEYYPNRYRFFQSIPLRLFVLLFSQLYCIVSLFGKVSRRDVIYVNTILPFGAALLGKLKGARVIYHVHETSINPPIFKRFLLFWIRKCADDVIYVSEFLATAEPLGKPSVVLWNAIERDFVERASRFQRVPTGVHNVLMLASLKPYKGVDEFVAIARACRTFSLDLVDNATTEGIVEYFSGQELPENLSIHPAQADVHPFYRRADVVMNLSRPDEWVETFGLTALEAMCYGIPVIVPRVGGIAEIVPPGLTGFHHNGRDVEGIAARLHAWRAEPQLYRSMGERAAIHAGRFSEADFLNQSLQIIADRRSKTKSPFQQLEHT